MLRRMDGEGDDNDWHIAARDNKDVQVSLGDYAAKNGWAGPGNNKEIQVRAGDGNTDDGWAVVGNDENEQVRAGNFYEEDG